MLASLDELDSGEVYEQIGKVGTALMQSLRNCAEASGLALHIQGLPMAFHASFAPPDQGGPRLPLGAVARRGDFLRHLSFFLAFSVRFRSGGSLGRYGFR